MYIEPNSKIKFYKNIPLDSSYNHTLYFSSISSQSNYFASPEFTIDNNTYARFPGGVVKVEKKADSLYPCNYMAFQNTNFGQKWFYAFITSVEYVNNETSKVTFEIDVMQTYLFDVTLKQSLVEREHSLFDTIGFSITSEPVEIGEYVTSDYKSLLDMTDMLVVIAIVDVENTVSAGITYDKIYSGAELYAYQSNDVTGINNKVKDYITKPDAILSMYMIPDILYPGVPTGGTKISSGSSGVGNTVTATPISGTEDFQGYVPKNKKLYTFPYNFFNLDNANGGALPMRYEFFESLTPVIQIRGTITQPVKVMARPCSYKGVPGYSQLGGYTTLNTESLSLESFPMCSWNMDTFKAWVAQNSVPIAMSVGSSIINKTVPTDLVNTTFQKSIAADVCRGNADNGGVNCASGKQQFYQSRTHITGEYARIIDDFFTMYGYTCGKVKIPNRSDRPRWNYTKTKGCVLQGNAPVDDVKKICSIYDNGITFWKNASEVGNYSLDNSVGSPI